MKFLLDTCTISEPKQKQPNAKVLEWLGAQDETNLYLSVLTIGEINKGIFHLEQGRKRVELEVWLEKLRIRFSRRILPIYENTFLIWGRTSTEFAKNGIIRPSLDSLLEATALEHDLILVTRNIKNFQSSKVTILNPWED